jgi:hypothetical protein
VILKPAEHLVGRGFALRRLGQESLHFGPCFAGGGDAARVRVDQGQCIE